MASHITSDNGTKPESTELRLNDTNAAGERKELLPLSDDEDIGDFKADSSYTRKKTVAKGCLDFALLMANTSQLKALLQTGKKNDLYYQLIVMIIISILLQVIVGIILILLGASEPRTRKSHQRAEQLNNTSVILILIITVLNLIISSLGISAPK